MSADFCECELLIGSGELIGWSLLSYSVGHILLTGSGELIGWSLLSYSVGHILLTGSGELIGWSLLSYSVGHIAPHVLYSVGHRPQHSHPHPPIMRIHFHTNCKVQLPC